MFQPHQKRQELVFIEDTLVCGNRRQLSGMGLGVLGGPAELWGPRRQAGEVWCFVKVHPLAGWCLWVYRAKQLGVIWGFSPPQQGKCRRITTLRFIEIGFGNKVLGNCGYIRQPVIA